MALQLTSNLKSQLGTVLLITIAWTLISIMQFFLGYASLIDMKHEIVFSALIVHIKGSVLTGILAGLIGGSGVVFLWERWLRTRPYGWTLINIFISYSIIYLIVAIPVTLFFRVNELGQSIASGEVWVASLTRIFSPVSLIYFVFWLIIVIMTMIALQVNDKYGPGVFKDFLLGRYFNPQREERVFMFLDLRSSTAIAEKLGEERYFNFLKEVYGFVTPSILNNRGEIYQYVGDEIVISWKTTDGMENINCLTCFFDVKKALMLKKSYFEEAYEQVPEFKAGLHYGHVMAGEIGVVKRDIVFSGDVLNTTARIQSKCNELGVDILVSKFLMDKLRFEGTDYQPKEIGTIPLRGKEESVSLFTF